MSLQAKYLVHRGAFTLNVELDISSVGITAIYGASGSGKTTLLRAMAGLDPVTEASLKVDGSIWHDAQLCLSAHERPLGYVFQEPSLFAHLNVQQNIDYGRQRSAHPLAENKLEELIDLLALRPLLTRSTQALSGGEQQRVAIARALAPGPKLLLMDEPLSALDQARKDDVLPYLLNINQALNIPIVYVSHVAQEIARIADNVVLLEAGRVIATGSTADVFSRLDLSLAVQTDAEVILHACVDRVDQQYDISYLTLDGGELQVTALAMEKGASVRVRVAARDVSLTKLKQLDTSILNILAAKVIEIRRVGSGQALVKLAIGNDFLLSRITEKSLDQLGLSEGMEIFAQIKSAAVLR